jgi:hypothetical protein
MARALQQKLAVPHRMAHMHAPALVS